MMRQTNLTKPFWKTNGIKWKPTANLKKKQKKKITEHKSKILDQNTENIIIWCNIRYGGDGKNGWIAYWID
jgi:hypothetical protein